MQLAFALLYQSALCTEQLAFEEFAQAQFAELQYRWSEAVV
jgi:hypothetical protein